MVVAADGAARRARKSRRAAEDLSSSGRRATLAPSDAAPPVAASASPPHRRRRRRCRCRHRRRCRCCHRRRCRCRHRRRCRCRCRHRRRRPSQRRWPRHCATREAARRCSDQHAVVAVAGPFRRGFRRGSTHQSSLPPPLPHAEPRVSHCGRALLALTRASAGGATRRLSAFQCQRSADSAGSIDGVQQARRDIVAARWGRTACRVGQR